MKPNHDAHYQPTTEQTRERKIQELSENIFEDVYLIILKVIPFLTRERVLQYQEGRRIIEAIINAIAARLRRTLP